MNSYKFKVGQRVSFPDPKTKIHRTGVIVETWWYACQGFIGFPMYDIDCGEYGVVTGVDEDKITLITTPKQSALSAQGQVQLRKALADKRADLRASLKETRKLKEEIKRIKEALKQI